MFDLAGFLIFILVFVSHPFELGRNVSCEESTCQSRMGLTIDSSDGLTVIVYYYSYSYSYSALPPASSGAQQLV